MISKNIAVEVLYDKKQENIISYIEIDPTTLTKKWSESDNRFIWIQYENIEYKKRILFDTQIITNF